MDMEELSPAESERFAKYLKSDAIRSRRAAIFVAESRGPISVIRKFNAEAMAAEVVARKLMRPAPDPGPPEMFHVKQSAPGAAKP